MLTLDNVRVRLGDFTLTANLTVATGARISVLGPSGAGKSTLLSAIAGFQPVEQGRILWQGVDLTGMPPAKRPVSILFQDGNLFPHLTAWQNVALGLRPSLRLSDGEKAQVDAALARVGLAGLGGRKPAQLSGGQAARVALARVTLMRRPVLLLDEPFGALGPALKSEMLALVQDLADETGATVLLVSHEPADARALADQVILAADGQAYPPAPIDEIFADPPETFKDYLGRD